MFTETHKTAKSITVVTLFEMLFKSILALFPFPSIDCNEPGFLAKATCLFTVTKDAFPDIFIAKLTLNNRDIFKPKICS